jgi:hypothetical protein
MRSGRTDFGIATYRHSSTLPGTQIIALLPLLFVLLPAGRFQALPRPELFFELLTYELVERGTSLIVTAAAAGPTTLPTILGPYWSYFAW